MVADNLCGLPIIHQVGEVLFGGPAHESNQRDVARSDSGSAWFFSQHAMPEVVMNVIFPPTPPPFKKKQVVNTVNFLKNPKARFGGKNSSSWKKLRNTANTCEFVQRHKNRAFKKSRKSRLSENVPTTKRTANTSTSGCCDHKKKTKNHDWQLEEEKRVNNRFSKGEML